MFKNFFGIILGDQLKVHTVVFRLIFFKQIKSILRNISILPKFRFRLKISTFLLCLTETPIV